MPRRREAPRGHLAAPWGKLVADYESSLAGAGYTRRVWESGAWVCPTCRATAPAEGLCSCVADGPAKS
jgi:hypothetical protein